MSERDGLRLRLFEACQILTATELVKAFGHVSARLDKNAMLITPRRPLALVREDDIIQVDLDGSRTPPGTPLEVWMHRAIYASRPDVEAICRFHAPAVATFASACEPLPICHGFGTHLGTVVPVYRTPRLITDAALGSGVAAALSDAEALLLRANGAVVTGASVSDVVAKAILLEESAEIVLRARAAGMSPLQFTELEAAERRSDDAANELDRLWDHALWASQVIPTNARRDRQQGSG